MIGRLLVAGLLLGLSMGPVCVLTCAPVLGATVAGELGRGGRASLALARFLAGRLVGYAAFGAAAGGLLGGALARLGQSGAGAVAAAAALVLGLALIVFGARRWASRESCAPASGGFFCTGRSLLGLAGAPFLFGLLTGASPCPPFLLATFDAVRAGSWLGGLVLFLGFFAGSSVFLAPALLLRAGSDRARRVFARLGSAAAVLVGLGFALSGLRGLSEAARGPGAVSLTEAQARRVLPEAERFERAGLALRGLGEAPASAAAPKLVGFAVRGEAIGYSGAPVSVVVGISPEGTILRVELLANTETPSYLAMLERGPFLERFRGRTLKETADPGKAPDAVTGATATCRAVDLAVRGAVLSLERPEGLAAAAEPPWQLPGTGDLIASGLVLLVAVLLPWLSGAARRLCLVAAVAVLGLWLQRFFSVADLARLGSGTLPRGAAGAGTLLFLVVLAGVTLWRGRFWCTHLCPFGALAELAGWVAHARARTPPVLVRAARVLPWAMLAAICAAVAWTGRLAAADAEPFATTFRVLALKLSAAQEWRTAPAALALAALLLAASLFSARFYCRHLCGAGAVLRLMAGAGARSEERPPVLEVEEGVRRD